MSPEVSLALLCYNECALIEEVVRSSVASMERLGRPWEMLVIDNHSTDGTPDKVEKMAREEPRLRLVVHETNRFYAGSCKTALREARGRCLAIMDSDGQFSADDLPQLLRAVDEGASLVLGWRVARHDPFVRKVMSAVFNVLARVFLGSTLRDLNVGLRMVDRRFIAVADIRHALNLANPELYVCARRAGLKIAEVPVSHRPRKRGDSCNDPRRMLSLFLQVSRYFLDLRRRLLESGDRPT